MNKCVFLAIALSSLVAAAESVLYQNDFNKLEVGKVPEELLVLDGGFAGRPDLKAICGGEALLLELAERLGAKVGQLWNVYGPTETTIWSTAEQVGGDGARVGAVVAPRGT